MGRGGAPVIAPDVAVNQAAEPAALPSAALPSAALPSAALPSAALPSAAFSMIADATATDEPDDEPLMVVTTTVASETPKEP